MSIDVKTFTKENAIKDCEVLGIDLNYAMSKIDSNEMIYLYCEILERALTNSDSRIVGTKLYDIVQRNKELLFYECNLLTFKFCISQ